MVNSQSRSSFKESPVRREPSELVRNGYLSHCGEACRPHYLRDKRTGVDIGDRYWEVEQHGG